MKHVENRVDEIEAKVKGVQADVRELKSDFQRMDLGKFRSNIYKILLLKEAIFVLVKIVDTFINVLVKIVDTFTNWYMKRLEWHHQFSRIYKKL